MILAYALLIGLAAFRLWRILAEDTIAEPFREWLYTENRHTFKASRWRTFFADLVSCVWCLGWWYAGALAALVTWHADYDWPEFVLLWLSGSALAGLAHKANAE